MRCCFEQRQKDPAYACPICLRGSTAAAVLSPCEKYRYTLTRRIPQAIRWVKPCLFVMLNPSTANSFVDDPTIRRCIGFATSWGCTSLTVVNLFALRATDPAELMKHDDPVGPMNERYVTDALNEHQLGVIVAAWGAQGITKKQIALQKVISAAGAQSLGVTNTGAPRHPLYIKADQSLQPWAASA